MIFGLGCQENFQLFFVRQSRIIESLRPQSVAVGYLIRKVCADNLSNKDLSISLYLMTNLIDKLNKCFSSILVSELCWSNIKQFLHFRKFLEVSPM